MTNSCKIRGNFVWLHAVVKAACCHSWNCSLWLTKQKQVVELTLKRITSRLCVLISQK